MKVLKHPSDRGTGKLTLAFKLKNPKSVDGFMVVITTATAWAIIVGQALTSLRALTLPPQ